MVVAVVSLLWAIYSAFQIWLVITGQDGVWFALLSFIPGLLSVWALLSAGLQKPDLYLRFAWPSWKGLLALAALAMFWPFILGTGRFIGWNTEVALVQGAGGIAQELFFRSALLPLLLVVLKLKPWKALLLHTVLFGLWHAGAFWFAPQYGFAGPIAITTVSLVAGIIWGWQTMHDRTVVWAMLHHAGLWVIGSLFYLGPPG